MILLFYNILLFVIDYAKLIRRLCFTFARALFLSIFPGIEKSVEGEIVLVSGAGAGIGRNLAKLFARLGAKVICWDINEESNNETVSSIQKEGLLAYGYVCDVSNKEEIKRVGEQVSHEVGQVTILINNAGILKLSSFLNQSDEDVQRVVDVTLMSQIWMVRQFLPNMISAGHGHIVAISSVAGKVGAAKLVPYSIAKFGVTGMMEALSEEIRTNSACSGIKFTAVHPYIVNTGMLTLPQTRYPWLLKVAEPEDAAKQIVDGVLRNYESVYVPEYMRYFIKIIKLLPHEGQHMIMDLFAVKYPDSIK